MVTESEYQGKALEYWRAKGLDVTSEWVMDYMTGSVPYAWHFNARTQEDYINVPATVYTGSGINPDIKTSDFGLGFLFGTSMYGEDIWPIAIKNEGYNEEWEKDFAREFYLKSLQYFFLNKLDRKSVTGTGDERTAYFSDGVSTSLRDSLVSRKNVNFREGNTVLFPVVWKDEPSIATYSLLGENSKRFNLPDLWQYLGTVDLYEISTNGLHYVGKRKVSKGGVVLNLKAGQPYLIKPR